MGFPVFFYISLIKTYFYAKPTDTIAMIPAEAHKKLSEISDVILAEELDFFALKNAIEELKRLLFGLSRLNMDAKVNEQNLQLQKGYAIGPKWAGLCLEDMMRTKRFMCGIYKAVEKVKKKKDGPVVIMYAGTGPFATLILPLLSKYSPKELQLVLLEVNEISIESTKRIIKGFDAYDYIKEMYHCDATNFEYRTHNDEIDIFLVECLQHALAREPQVAITYNLLPQLPKDVVLIPEEISLKAALIDMDLRDEYMELIDGIKRNDYYELVKPVFTINKETVLNHEGINEHGQLEFTQVATEFIDERLDENDAVAIATEITVFEDEKLAMDECGLTVPLILANLNVVDKMKGMNSRYIVDEFPRIHTEFVK